MLNQHKTTRDNIARYNKPNLLVHYPLPFIRDKVEVSILDVGSGPYSVIGDHLDGVNIKITHCDNHYFDEFYKKYSFKSIITVDHQDMEKLTYVDNFFDIVHCANALDHTKDAVKAVAEMMRICKPGGYVYIVCNLCQMDTGHKHFWNAREDGTFDNAYGSFNLKDFGFTVSYLDLGGEKRYNQIIGVYHKIIS